jgi:hypothetical protein
LLIVVPVELGVGDGAGFGVGEGAGLVVPEGGDDALAPGAVAVVAAAGGVVLVELDCIEALPPPHPAMDISNEMETSRVTAWGGTSRISQF